MSVNELEEDNYEYKNRKVYNNIIGNDINDSVYFSKFTGRSVCLDSYK